MLWMTSLWWWVMERSDSIQAEICVSHTSWMTLELHLETLLAIQTPFWLSLHTWEHVTASTDQGEFQTQFSPISAQSSSGAKSISVMHETSVWTAHLPLPLRASVDTQVPWFSVFPECEILREKTILFLAPGLKLRLATFSLHAEAHRGGKVKGERTSFYWPLLHPCSVLNADLSTSLSTYLSIWSTHRSIALTDWDTDAGWSRKNSMFFSLLHIQGY